MAKVIKLQIIPSAALHKVLSSHDAAELTYLSCTINVHYLSKLPPIDTGFAKVILSY